MSFSPQTESKFSRSDLFAVDPTDIKVDWSKNLARDGKEPPLDDDLKQLAMSMRPKNQGGNGQLQAVIVRPLPDRTLQLIGGFRRLRAALWLRESGECPDFVIQCVVRRLNDSEAAVSNLVENLDRKDITPLELAHAVRSLTEDYGLPMPEVAIKLNRSQQWLDRILDLTVLPDPIQEAVKTGKTSVSAALEIASLPPDRQIEVFDSAKDANGKVSASEVKNKKRAEGEAIPRSIKHLRTILAELNGPAENPEGRKLIKHLLAYMDGKLEDSQFYDRWQKIFPAPPTN